MDYLVTGTEQGRNQVFFFSTTMHELCRTKLAEKLFHNLNDDPNANIKVNVKDVKGQVWLLNLY